MEIELYNKAKALEARIQEMKRFKQYIEAFLKREPFTVTLETSVYGYSTVRPIIVNGRGETLSRYISDSDDGKYIINSIQSLIDLLEKEFLELK